MKSITIKHLHRSLLNFCLILTFFSCNYNNRSSKPEQSLYKKPVSNYQDSFKIDASSAVFYHPDSLQLLQIKRGMDSSFYDGTMHEFFYQIRNAKIVLKKWWPKIKIIDAKNIRFLVFQKTNGQSITIDLDKRNDAFGLFLFDQIKSPLLIDMTNIETSLSTYFGK